MEKIPELNQRINALKEMNPKKISDPIRNFGEAIKYYGIVIQAGYKKIKRSNIYKKAVKTGDPYQDMADTIRKELRNTEKALDEYV